MTYRPEIDGLRAVAVLAVVIFHAVPAALPGGFVGVDVFFVISGYLITTILATEHARTGRIDFGDFYVRRIRRLLPALLLVLVYVLGAAIFVLGPRGVGLAPIAESVWASLGFVANFHFLAFDGGYFAAADQPLLHLWSLAVEEQFYLLFPLVMLLPRRTAIIATLALGSLALSEAWPDERAFYMMPARFWELAAGALIALSPPRGRAFIGWGVGLIVVSAVLTPHSGFPGLEALPAALGAGIVILGVHRGGTSRLLASRPFVGIGLASYGFYLWHWPLLTIDAAMRIGPASTSWRLLLCGIALALAFVSLRFVERPVRQMRLPRRQWYAGAATAGVALAVAAWGVGEVQMVSAERAQLVEKGRRDRPANMRTCHYAIADEVHALRVPECLSRPGVPRVAIWGDSHALAWQPFAWELAQVQDVPAVSLTMNSCSPMHRTGVVENCLRFNRLALDYLASMDTVVIAARWPVAYPGAERKLIAHDELVTGLADALDALAGVPRVLVIAPVPELRDDAGMCIIREREDACSYTRAQFDAAAAPVRSVLATLAESHANVTLVDATDYFCDDDLCRVTRDGTTLYWDDDHVTSSAARTFAQRWLSDGARLDQRVQSSRDGVGFASDSKK